MSKKKPAKRKTIHPQVAAWNEWANSDEGRAAREPFNFNPPGYWEFLENRLVYAFIAGYEAGEKTRGGR